MNQNQQYGMSNGYPMPTQNQGFKLEIPQQDKNLYMGYFASVVLLIIGCFLPFAVMKAGNLSMNYISYDGDIKDGVYVIGLIVVAAFCLIKRKHLVSAILQGIGIAVFAIDTFDMLDRMKKANAYAGLLGDSYKTKFGIGFYLVLVALAVGAVIILMLLKKSKNGAQPAAAPVQNQMQPQGMPVQPQPSVPTQQYCPYCRTPKTEGSPFCSNCGAKF